MADLKGLRGAGTALVTPFTSDDHIDEAAIKRLVDFQINGGIDFLVPCGTTGESATLTIEEHLHVVELVVKHTAGRVPVIGGAGSNDTAYVVTLAQEVAKAGADALLSVTPYYNKPSQEGLFQHYKKVAEAVDLPIIVYNVPGRTNCNILPDTMVKLAEIDNIIGVKEASGNIAQIAEIGMKVPEDFIILSGDDPATIPIISVGGVGVISVLSNQVPGEVSKIVKLCLENKYPEARKIQKKYIRLTALDFIETNPVPVKTSLSMMGLMEEHFRLPLVNMKESNKALLKQEMKNLGLI
ncbi:MAG: 4-hydroxy-tetrahydrodipicolinate synthase [Calditrichaceae bacterium]|nr:4-hydroxy-tetrahydrodipicolinate synthase [Calditrichaceae bacterium]